MTQQKYSDYIVENILQPLGMTTSGWTLEEVNTTQFAKRYIGEKVVPNYRLITYPDGGLFSSTQDLSTYLMAMLKGYYGESNILPASAFQTLLQNQYQGTPLSKTTVALKSRRGIFWDIFGETGTGDIGHSGSDPGITTFMYFNPDTGIGCILTTNVDTHTHGEQVVKLWRLLIKHRVDFELVL